MCGRANGTARTAEPRIEGGGHQQGEQGRAVALTVGPLLLFLPLSWFVFPRVDMGRWFGAPSHLTG
jgi:hypothetical protein